MTTSSEGGSSLIRTIVVPLDGSAFGEQAQAARTIFCFEDLVAFVGEHERRGAPHPAVILDGQDPLRHRFRGYLRAVARGRPTRRRLAALLGWARRPENWGEPKGWKVSRASRCVRSLISSGSIAG